MRKKMLVAGHVATAAAGLTLTLSATGASAAPESTPAGGCSGETVPVHVVQGTGSGPGTVTSKAFSSNAAADAGGEPHTATAFVASSQLSPEAGKAAPAGPERDTICMTITPVPAQK